MADAPETKPRWYRLTPDRLVLGLLAVEGLLLLSQWGGWLPFNRHKGWTVLMAVAAVGLTLLWMLLWFAAALIFRCRFQYSLRSLFVLVFAVAIPCSWLATEMQAARRQRDALIAIADVLHGYVTMDYLDTVPGTLDVPYPEWLGDLLGDDFFTDVTSVYLTGRELTDRDLGHLRAFCQLVSGHRFDEKCYCASGVDRL
jgi:hypothetical protein